MKDAKGFVRGLDVMIETDKRLTANFSRSVASATRRAKTEHNIFRSARGELYGGVQTDNGWISLASHTVNVSAIQIMTVSGTHLAAGQTGFFQVSSPFTTTMKLMQKGNTR